ncbi:MAG: hypothetical protein KDK70_18475 [Myxococcales bacterium]|nr:hypothetical protein [Myxococcales bacterium]
MNCAALQPLPHDVLTLVAERDLGWESPLELAHPGPMPALLEERAGLTMAALGREAASWIDAYQAQGEISTDRPDDFLEFVIARVPDRVVVCMARFERALSIARAAQVHDDLEPRARLGRRLRMHPAAAMVDLPGPAEEVIGAIALGLSPPAYSGWPVLVAPGLPTLWRQATPVEDALCTWLTRPRSTAEVRERFVGADRVLQRLLAARAIIGA